MHKEIRERIWRSEAGRRVFRVSPEEIHLDKRFGEEVFTASEPLSWGS